MPTRSTPSRVGVAGSSHRRVLHSSNSDEWGTPISLFRELDRLYGPFALDACASGGLAKLGNYYGLDHPDPLRRDALQRDWTVDAFGGAVWLNPPYSRTLFPRFLRKADETARDGTRVVLLFPSMKTGTSAFQTYILPHLATGAGTIRFLPGRVSFECPGRPAGPAPSPSLVVVLN